MAMALPVYAEVDPLPGAPDEVELLEDKPETASGEDTIEQLPDATAPPKQNAATPVPEAATPEPEQSAEPEQPAPTETPEPTAEPTLTPEPTATATATPVPTVTPTATPEPTEQPQKMYAARSEDNVQAVSEQEAADGFTVYFVVPATMPDNNNNVQVLDSYEIRFNANFNGWHSHPMEWTGWKTEDGRKIYAVKNCKDIKGDKFDEIQFQLYDGPRWKAEIKPNNVSQNTISYYNNKMYVPDGDGRSGTWGNNSILTNHTYYKGKPIKFENRSTANLTNVKANFYLLEADETLTLVNDGSESKTVDSGNFVSFDIPTDACSYVRFTWEGGSSKYYNFYNEDVSGNDRESFIYSEANNCFIYTGADNERWGIENSFRIYYDATFSKLLTTGTDDTGGNFSIPKTNQSTVYYRLKEKDKESIGGPMSRIEGTDYYAADVPDGYTQIVFSSYQLDSDDITTTKCGETTDWVTIPSDYNVKEQCFYADTNDDAVYSKGVRGGYWAPKGTLRDAETWKNPKTKVVDIKSAEFTEKPNTKYVTSTLYDYYTDYELNGKNRKNYDCDNTVNQRHWVPFRQFDQAISDYYQSYVDKNIGKSIIYPIYTGHFQPSGWYMPFSAVAATLNLYGWAENYQIFIAANNSNLDIGNGTDKNKYAFQGIVADQRDSDGDIVMNGTTLKEPHFNEEFLTSKNSKNAKLGEVYHNVEFPFTQEEVFVEPAEQNGQKKGEGIKYWWFDSSITSLYLRKDTKRDQLYLGNDSTGETNAKYKAEYKSDKSHNVDSANNSDPSKVSTEYGFFPFNENTTSNSAVNYNYGYGAKLEIPFTLTSTGTVMDDYGNEIPIRFYFSGDDDVWVFIDDQLVLDIGGAHAKVSGVLEFDQRDGKKDTVTSYVSKVKNNKTQVAGAVYGADNCDEHNHETETRITYLGKTETYYKNARVSVPNLSTGKHTLTMYYMERGMWESNMAVAFNLPDNNELQVQKIVDTTGVNEWFKSCFDTPDLFAFNIQNQATHYQNPNHDATIGSDVKPIELNTSDYESYEPATKNSTGNIFELTTAPDNTADTLHWYAQYQDTNPPSDCRSMRYGILTLRSPQNISQMRYLTFDIYAKSESGQGELSLGNLYLELLDNQGRQKGCLGTTCLNGTTYGTVTLENGKWITVKLDLYKLNAEDKFDLTQVTTIRVGDNYPRHIYFKDFVFSAQAKATTKTGFTTKQEDIPVYGSINAGCLTNAEGAQFTSDQNNDTQVVDENGQFMLQNGETVTFSDQFRRGSYISLKETLSPNLYDTTWTVFENDEAVQSYGTGKTVLGNTKDLKEQDATESQPGPDDGRTEVYNEAEGIANKGYTKSQKPENANTIVFRSYENPDEDTSSLTKLKVQFVNKVKTGKLVIKKAAASDEVDLIKGKYTFNVTFTNVGDESLEQEPIKKQVTIDMSTEKHEYVIEGIPIGTRFRIEEVTPEDESHLQGVSVTGGGVDTQVVANTYVQGSISGSGTNVTATFTNTMHELINIDFTKTWENANGSPLEDGLPGEIYIQLQRRKTKNDPWKPVRYPEDAKTEYVTVTPARNGWNCAFTFANLDKFDVKDQNHTNYQYRIVEGTVDEKGNFTKVEPKETIPIKGNTYVVTAKAEAKISDGDGATTTPATTPDGTITGGSGTIELTNKLQNPKFVLDIIKQDANDKKTLLDGVEFKLEKLVKNEGKTQWEVDNSYPFNNTNTGSITAITGKDGKITGVFKDLKPGRYRLTETKAHEGYNLLSKSIDIEFTQDGMYKIDDGTAQKATGDAASGYTVTFTVLNRKTPELPHTGADAPSLWLLIGLPLAVAGLLIFTFRYNRKGGRRH